MEAIVLHQPGKIEENPLKLVQLPTPTPAPHQLLLKVSACGLCHTDLHIIEGELPPHKLPLIPGHQIVGVVEEVGEGVLRFKKGDRVGVPWLNFACGVCSFCQQGKENLCLNPRFTGYDVDGGYARYTVVDEDFAHPIPSAFSDTQAAPLLCAGAIGFRALKLTEPQKGSRLGLFGFGASAHIVLQIANYWGCQVYVFTRSKDHQELAKELGAVWVGRAEETPPVKLDGAILFAPAGELVIKALEKLDKGGRLTIAGIYLSPIPPIDYRLLYQERRLQSVANCTREDVRSILELAPQIPIKVQTQLFTLKEANQALLLLKQGKIQGSGVLVIG